MWGFIREVACQCILGVDCVKIEIRETTWSLLGFGINFLLIKNDLGVYYY